jgi:hypothetical protein
MIALLHPVFIHYRFFPRCSPINELTNLSKDYAHVREGGTGPDIEDSNWRTFTIIAAERDSIDSLAGTRINSSLDHGRLENNDFFFPSFITSKSQDILQHSFTYIVHAVVNICGCEKYLCLNLTTLPGILPNCVVLRRICL